MYEYNLGLRTSMSMTDAMLSNSLLLDFLEKNGLEDYKGKSTRDVICIKFSFGCNELELVVSFVGEDEHRILEWISVQDRLDICTQSIYAFAKVHRFSDQV